MGNKSCTLAIHTEKSIYFSGETVKGRVYLSVNDTNGIVAQSLNIRFSGIERAVVHYTQRDNDDDDWKRNDNDNFRTEHDHYEENEIQILSFDAPINTPNGSLFPAGQYEFPFQFVIPQNVPSSMECRNGESKCEICYEMISYLSKYDRKSVVNLFNSNTISSQPLSINIVGSSNSIHNSLYFNQPIDFPTEIHNIRNCCCFQKGRMELRASMESSFFVPHQQRNLSINLRNNSSAKVENVTIEVIERVIWKPRVEQQMQQFTIAKYLIDGSSHQDWMSSDQLLSREEYVSLSPTSSKSLTHSSHNVKICIPHNARDTYTGRIIQVHHYVRVKVVTEGFCVSNPETTCDINISRNVKNRDVSLNVLDTNNNMVDETALPPDWSPLLSELITLPVADVISVTPQPSNENENNKTDRINNF